MLLSAIPGRDHLIGLKEVLYDTPYLNDEKEPQTEGFKVIERIRVQGEISLDSREDIDALFRMTPYYYHTPSRGMKRLEERDSLSTPIDFVIIAYKKA